MYPSLGVFHEVAKRVLCDMDQPLIRRKGMAQLWQVCIDQQWRVETIYLSRHTIQDKEISTWV